MECSPVLSLDGKVEGTNLKNQVDVSPAELEIRSFCFAIVYTFSPVCKVSDSIICTTFICQTSVHLSEIPSDYPHLLLKN